MIWINYSTLLLLYSASALEKGMSVHPSVHPFVRPSVRPSMVTHELKPCKSAIFDQNYYQYERERILCLCIRPCLMDCD